MFVTLAQAFQIKYFVFNFQLFVYVYVHKDAGVLGDQKTVLYLLELELQVVVNHPEWVPGAELSSSAQVCVCVCVHSDCSSTTVQTFMEIVCLTLWSILYFPSKPMSNIILTLTYICPWLFYGLKASLYFHRDCLLIQRYDITYCLLRFLYPCFKVSQRKCLMVYAFKQKG